MSPEGRTIAYTENAAVWRTLHRPQREREVPTCTRNDTRTASRNPSLHAMLTTSAGQTWLQTVVLGACRTLFDVSFIHYCHNYNISWAWLTKAPMPQPLSVFGCKVKAKIAHILHLSQ